MRIPKCLDSLLLSLMLCAAFTSCEEGNGVEDFAPKEYNVSGRVEKGPFVSGSAITIQPMSEQIQVLGVMYSSTIQDHTGNFSFGTKQFESPYAELTANGYFFNEVTGRLSSGTLYLRAIVDLTKSETVNVNILTHIKYQRVLNLISQGKSYAEANKQAQEELFAAFGLQRYADKDVSLYSIIEGTDESAALIAISSLILVERSEAEMTEYLARLCKEFADNGKFSDNTKEQIKEDREKLSSKLSDISWNIRSRYNDLGIEVEVKELIHFFDWNDDGIAGNETLKEGETISLDTDSLKVPYTGGNYTIEIETTIPVYLVPLGELVIPPTNVVYPDAMFGFDLYQFSTPADEDIAFEKSIKENVLTVNVSELNSYQSKSTHIKLYDCMGTILDTLVITQEANPNIAPPQCLGLSEDGKAVFASLASQLAEAFSNYNVVEQHYHYNKDVLVYPSQGLVDSRISPSNNNISSSWASFYKANNSNNIMRYYDALSATLFPQVFDVYSAMIYYNMVVGWGDVPYILYPIVDDSSNLYPSRSDQDDVLDDLTKKLTAAIPLLDEKKNESLTNIDDLFFVSKDVARILLANIYMYRQQYSEALALLQAVVDGGFYSLDNSNYSNPSTIDSLFKERTSSELIFAFDASSGTRTTRSEGVVIRQASLVPIMTYTDVQLSYAECLYYAGNTNDAGNILHQVVEAKGIDVADGLWDGITDARRQLLLYSIGNFAFYKRNNIAIEELGIKEYQLLFPIPDSEMFFNYNMTQNPGYK